VACHVPTGSLRLTNAEAVLRLYEHKNVSWKDQDTLTVTFAEELTLARLARLAGLALSSSRSARDERIAQAQAIPSAFPSVARDAMPAINLPDDPERALQILEALYERGADPVISAAFDQFAAVLGSNSAERGCCYMSEINLGMAGRGRPDRIRAGKVHFKAKLRNKRYLPGSLHYTIGNAYSALGDEKSAKDSYQAAARDAVYMADPGMAAMCLKNLGASFEKAYELNGGHYGYCLGTALNFLGRYGEALPLVQAQADGIQPDAMSWFQVASALDHLGRSDEAIAAYRKALFLDPDYAVAMFNMAGVLWNLGDREEGGRIFRTAVRQFPDHELSEKARQDFPSLF